MAKKKKTKKRPTKPKRPSSKKVSRKAKRPQKLAKKKSAPKRATAKRKVASKKPALKRRRAEAAPFSVSRSDSRFGGQAGDLQGLSGIERADSESVDELLEEGNAFEADVVAGVEDAGARAEREVHTREVPEDDVPEEYLDEQ
jgi:hypothetical protein